jgi:hypothetical protein
MSNRCPTDAQLMPNWGIVASADPITAEPIGV